MNQRLLKILMAVSVCLMPAFGLHYSTGNFRTHFGGGSDTSGLAAGWGDSLMSGVASYGFSGGFPPTVLNNNAGLNGASGANPDVSVNGDSDFRIAYIAWSSPNAYQVAPYQPPQAGIVMRAVTFDTAAGYLAADGQMIASGENPADGGALFYTGQDPLPPPGYLHFAAEGGGYAAYWSTLNLSGSLRRTSDDDALGKPGAAQYGVYVPSGAPDVLPYYGTVGMAHVPGSGANRVITAYETGAGPAAGRIRWEDLLLGTSDTMMLARPLADSMRDFAVAADSAGNALVLWREGGTPVGALWGAAYNAFRGSVMAPVRITAGNIDAQDYPDHTYRPFGAAALDIGRFAVVYGRGGAIYFRIVNTASGTPVGGEDSLTPGCGACRNPDVSVSNTFAAFSWYGNHLGGSFLPVVEGAVFSRRGDSIIMGSRQDISVPGSLITFTNVGDGWKPWHNMHVPNIGVDDMGNTVVVFDREFDAMAAGFLNRPLYYDTAVFTSRPLRVENPSLHAVFDSSIDSAEILSIDPAPAEYISLFLALSPDSVFDQSEEDFFPFRNGLPPVPRALGNFGWFRYRLILNADSLSNRSSPLVDSVEIRCNVKPRPAVIDSIQIGTGPMRDYDSSTVYNVVSRRDSLSVVVSAFDMDNAGAFQFFYRQGAYFSADSFPAADGGGYYRSRMSFSPFSASSDSFAIYIDARDSLGWMSTRPFYVNYINHVPVISAWFAKPRYPEREMIDTFDLQQDTVFTMKARDSAQVWFRYYDSNDHSFRVRFHSGNTKLLDTYLVDSDSFSVAWVPPRSGKNVLHRIRITDIDTTAEFAFRINYYNALPRFEAEMVKHRGAAVKNVYVPSAGGADTVPLAADTAFVLHAQDTAMVRLIVSDSTDSLLQLVVERDSGIFIDTLVRTGDTLLVPLFTGAAAGTVETVIRLRDPDTSQVLRLSLIPNFTPRADSITSRAGNVRIGTVRKFEKGAVLPVQIEDTNAIRLYYLDAGPATPGFPVISWRVISRPNSCGFNQVSCLENGPAYQGSRFSHYFNTQHTRLRLKVEDGYGAFILDTLTLGFPYLDTSVFADSTHLARMAVLNSDSPFVAGAGGRMDTLLLRNSGTSPLIVDSIYTGGDQSDLLSFVLQWNHPLTGPRRIETKGATNGNIAGGPLELVSGNILNVFFNFSPDSALGDRTVTDTLYVITNDRLTPILMFPFRFRHVDLPTVGISLFTAPLAEVLGKRSRTQDSVGNAMTGPVHIRFSFSEPVFSSTADTSTIRIYSALDSARLGQVRLIPGAAPGNFMRMFHSGPSGVPDPALTDTLIFTPDYAGPSEALGVRPLRGYFLPGDIIRIDLSNAITDTAGNGLNLSGRLVALPPGTTDSIFTIRVAAASLHTVRSTPKQGANDYDPQEPVRIRFSRPLARTYFHTGLGRDVLSVDTARLAPGTNRTVRVVSSYNAWQPHELAWVRLEDGDSTLAFKTRPNLTARDSVRVTIYSRLASTDGYTLDGDGNGFGMFFYDSRDSSDHLNLSFVAGREKFYVYPNPFKWFEPAHEEKGAITFTNLTSIDGIRPGKKVDFRIYTMNGDLVYSSERKSTTLTVQRDEAPQWDWDLRNNHGNKVGTGVYVYAVYINNDDLVKKGKLAVIR